MRWIARVTTRLGPSTLSPLEQLELSGCSSSVFSMRAALITSVAVVLLQTLVCHQRHNQRMAGSGGSDRATLSLWSSWGSWGECSHTCGGGVQGQTRVCELRNASSAAVAEIKKTHTPAQEHQRRGSGSRSGWRKANVSRISPGMYGYGRISFISPLQRDSSRTSRHKHRRSASVFPQQSFRTHRRNTEVQEPLPNTFCPGAPVQHKICNTMACPSSSRPVRELQCSSFNTQLFMGRRYQWEPLHDVSTDVSCELNCRAVGFRFYVRQADRVSDGTSCGPKHTALCVDGKCLSAGCDDLLGSGKVADRCGVCGGDNSACQLVSGLFQHSLSKMGYHKIIEIPLGATKINVTEKVKSRNYLALLSRSGRSIINGNWAIDRPGMYEGVGTMFTYRRPNEISSTAGESLLADGPTNEILDVYMIYQQPNPDVSYEFIMPSENTVDAHRPKDKPLHSSVLKAESGSDAIGQSTLDSREGSGVRFTPAVPDNHLPSERSREYNWKLSGSSDCSASCGRGSRFSVFSCVHRITHKHVPNALCDSSTKPSTQEEPCNLQPCPAFWDIGEWSECSKSCGLGMQHRQVLCRQVFANRTLSVHTSRCTHTERPETSSACQMKICSEWHIRTDWSPCSVPCGVGQRSREVHCISNVGDIVSDEECNMKLRPSDVENCDAGACSRSWFYSDWSAQCSSECGSGLRSRSVLCVSGQVSVLPLDSCGSDRPSEMQPCSSGPCESRTEWFIGPWSQCSAECGPGSQQRAVVCVLRTEASFSIIPAYECSSLDKPLAQQSCFIKACGAQWHYTDWSTCSRSCESGFRLREVLCLFDDMKPSDGCSQSLKPHHREACNPEPCLPLIDEKCRDKYFNCNVVVQARLCVYDYYQRVCCASCTRAAQRRTGH